MKHLHNLPRQYYCNRNGVWHTIGGCSLLNEREETMADVFSSSGYITGMFGKWHLGDTYPFRPRDRGFHETFYHGGGGVGQTPDYWNNDYFDDTYFRNGSPEKTEGYCTDVWFREAIRFIEKNQDKPFFCYLSTNAPHGPFNLPPAYLELYRDADLMPNQKRFYGMITNLDDNFGLLLDMLEEQNLADNTIVMFMTDNGTAAGIAFDKKTGKTFGYNAGMRGTKSSQYDGGHRVPFLIRWPEGGLTGGRDVTSLTAHVDILPTLAELCDLPFAPDLKLDGISLASLLLDGTDLPGRMLVTDTQRNQWPEKGRKSCVMDSEWRLVNNSELYNILEDPGQKTDLSGEFPERVKRMNDFYDLWWEEIETEMEYSQIRVGNDEQNPLMLTIHDLHSEEAIPWNQRHIREGKLSPEGYYSIEFEESAEYEFKFQRWPFESGMKPQDGTHEISSTEYSDGLPAGEAKLFRGMLIQLGEGTEFGSEISDDGSATLRARVPEGRYRVRFSFIDEEGREFAPYYISILKV